MVGYHLNHGEITTWKMDTRRNTIFDRFNIKQLKSQCNSNTETIKEDKWKKDRKITKCDTKQNVKDKINNENIIIKIITWITITRTIANRLEMY